MAQAPPSLGAWDPRVPGGQVLPPGVPIPRIPGSAQVTPPPVHRPSSISVDWGSRIPAQVKLQQQLLSKAGFKVSVDGRWGPQTSSAVEAFGKGQHPVSWNTWWGKHTARAAGGPAASGGGPGGGNPEAAGAGAAPTVTAPATTAPVGNSDVQKQIAQLIASYKVAGNNSGLLNSVLNPANIPLIDPTKYANDLVNGKYAGQIGGLERQVAQVDPQHDQNLEDIAGWFNQLRGVQQRGADQNAATSAAGIASQDSANAGVLASLGGASNSAAGEIGAAGINTTAALRGQGQAQAAYDQDLPGLVKLFEAQANMDESRRAGNQRSELAGQMSDLQASKGADYAAAIGDASGRRSQQMLDVNKQRFDQLGAVSAAKQNSILGLGNLLQTSALLPSQVTSAGLKNTAQQAQINAVNASTEATRAQLAQFRKDHAGAPGGAIPDFGQLKPGERSSIKQAIEAPLLGPGGYLRVSPQVFLDTMRNNLYGQFGFQPTPATEAYISSLLEPRFITHWNKFNPKRKYTG